MYFGRQMGRGFSYHCNSEQSSIATLRCHRQGICIKAGRMLAGKLCKFQNVVEPINN